MSKKVKLSVAVNGGDFHQVMTHIDRVQLDFNPLTYESGDRFYNMKITTKEAVIEFLCEYVENENPESGKSNY